MPTRGLQSNPEEPLSRLPLSATGASQFRYEVARALVALAPPLFGHEAILSGSASREVADESSDIEMVFYVLF